MWCLPDYHSYLPSAHLCQPRKGGRGRGGPVADPRGLTWKVGTHALDSFVGWTTALHFGAAGSTALLIATDVDADVQRWAGGMDEATSLGLSLPGLAGGMLVPITVPLGMYLFSDDPDVVQGAAAAGQSVILATLTNTLLKAITGRPGPCLLFST